MVLFRPPFPHAELACRVPSLWRSVYKNLPSTSFYLRITHKFWATFGQPPKFGKGQEYPNELILLLESGGFEIPTPCLRKGQAWTDPCILTCVKNGCRVLPLGVRIGSLSPYPPGKTTVARINRLSRRKLPVALHSASEVQDQRLVRNTRSPSGKLQMSSQRAGLTPAVRSRLGKAALKGNKAVVSEGGGIGSIEDPARFLEPARC